MRPSNPVSAGMPGPKTYIGWWGNMGGPKQKGIVQFSVSPWKQRPMAGALHGYIFNGAHRLATQLPYWIIPVTLGYLTISWGNERYAYYNSKEGHHQAQLEEGGHGH